MEADTVLVEPGSSSGPIALPPEGFKVKNRHEIPPGGGTKSVRSAGSSPPSSTVTGGWPTYHMLAVVRPRKLGSAGPSETITDAPESS